MSWRDFLRCHPTSLEIDVQQRDTHDGQYPALSTLRPPSNHEHPSFSPMATAETAERGKSGDVADDVLSSLDTFGINAPFALCDLKMLGTVKEEGANRSKMEVWVTPNVGPRILDTDDRQTRALDSGQ